MFEEKNHVKFFEFEPQEKDTFKSPLEVKTDLEQGKLDSMTVVNSEESFKVLPCHGYFFFETVHGDSGALLLDRYNCYIPKHMLQLFKGFGDDEIKAIKNGNLGISFYAYDSKQRKNCVGIRLHDI